MARSREGIRPGVWVAVSLAVAAAAGLVELSRTGPGNLDATPPAPVAGVADGAASRPRVGSRPQVGGAPAAPSPGAPGDALPLTRSGSRGATPGPGHPPQRATDPPANVSQGARAFPQGLSAPPLPRPAFSGPRVDLDRAARLRALPTELPSLEREAALRAVALDQVDAAAVEAALTVLEPLPGETPGAFQARLDDERAHLLATELLLQHRLETLYEGEIYPHGFPVEILVVPVQRRAVAALSPIHRSAALRLALRGGDPPNPEPRFYAPESGIVWNGGV